MEENVKIEDRRRFYDESRDETKSEPEVTTETPSVVAPEPAVSTDATPTAGPVRCSCGVALEAPPPALKIVNTPAICQAFFIPTRETCPGCGKEFVQAIASISVALMYQPARAAAAPGNGAILRPGFRVPAGLLSKHRRRI